VKFPESSSIFESKSLNEIISEKRQMVEDRRKTLQQYLMDMTLIPLIRESRIYLEFLEIDIHFPSLLAPYNNLNNIFGSPSSPNYFSPMQNTEDATRTPGEFLHSNFNSSSKPTPSTNPGATFPKNETRDAMMMHTPDSQNYRPYEQYETFDRESQNTPNSDKRSSDREYRNRDGLVRVPNFQIFQQTKETGKRGIGRDSRDLRTSQEIQRKSPPLRSSLDMEDKNKRQHENSISPPDNNHSNGKYSAEKRVRFDLEGEIVGTGDMRNIFEKMPSEHFATYGGFGSVLDDMKQAELETEFYLQGVNLLLN
jgi:hypothetical protein